MNCTYNCLINLIGSMDKCHCNSGIFISAHCRHRNFSLVTQTRVIYRRNFIRYFSFPEKLFTLIARMNWRHTHNSFYFHCFYPVSARKYWNKIYLCLHTNTQTTALLYYRKAAVVVALRKFRFFLFACSRCCFPCLRAIELMNWENQQNAQLRWIGKGTYVHINVVN